MSLGAGLKRHALDAFVVALAIAGLVEVWVRSTTQPKAAAAAGALLATLPFLLRRRFPFAAPVFVFVAVAGLAVALPDAVTEGASVTLLALLLAFWTVGARNERDHAVAGFAIGLAAVAVLAIRAASADLGSHPPFPGGAVRMGIFEVETVFFIVLVAGLSVAAYSLHARARRTRALEARTARLEHEPEEEVRVAAAAERRRIARDLHDLIGRGVNVMTVQAGAARLLLDEDPGRAREPLLSVEEAGRQTLAETRRLLGVLRTEDGETALAPRPGLAALGDLLGEVRAAGLRVDLAVDGDPRVLPPGVELTAYRVVEEALKDALEDDGAGRADVTLRYGTEAVEVAVTSGGQGVARDGESPPRGFLGLLERVALYGGELQAGSGPPSGYTVRASFPTGFEELASRQPSATQMEDRVRTASRRASGRDGGVRALLRRRGFDALVVLVAFVSEVEIFVASVPGPTLVLVPAVLLWTLPLLFRRRFPFGAPACVFAAQTAAAFAGDAVGGDITSTAAFFLAFWALGARNQGVRLLAGLALGFASVIVIAARDVRLQTGDAVGGIVTAGALVLVAFVLQRRARRASTLEEAASRLEREREEQARAAVAAERRRIARDLHDVTAHSVSVMTVQAGAARLLLEEHPDRSREALCSVEETGRQTLAEMRRLLGFLGRDAADAALAPRPGMAALPELLAQVRAAGLPVELSVEGHERALPPGVELAVYRIAQEALTNVRKHSASSSAGVALRYEPGALELEITNDGRPVTTGGGSGHGLVGMRERAALYGGEIEAGPQPAGGYAVRARLPLEAAAA